MNKELQTQLIKYGVPIAIGAVAFFYLKHKLFGDGGIVSESLNPASNKNIVYSGVNSVGASLTGSAPGTWSLGSWIYDITHPNESETIRRAGMIKNTAVQGSSQTGYTSNDYKNWVNNQTEGINE